MANPLMNMNKQSPLDMLKKIMGMGGNPKSVIMNLFKDSVGDTTIGNLISMANSGNYKGVEEYARKCCEQKGINYDEEINKFMKNFR